MHRWQDRGDALTRSPANRVRRRGERRNTGGYGFCNGFGTTPTEVSIPFSTPLPYFTVVSRSQGVAPAGTFQYLPWNVSISSVQHFLMICQFSSNASRLV
jgi:hypothetical protein